MKKKVSAAFNTCLHFLSLLSSYLENKKKTEHMRRTWAVGLRESVYTTEGCYEKKYLINQSLIAIILSSAKNSDNM